MNKWAADVRASMRPSPNKKTDVVCNVVSQIHGEYASPHPSRNHTLTSVDGVPTDCSVRHVKCMPNGSCAYVT
eukprot:6031544-Pyramimonas_sp.AAC.2